MSRRVFGPLLAIGGAEDKSRDRIILRRFVELSGGDEARIAVIPSASRIRDAGEQYRSIFADLGVEHVDVLDIRDRVDADSDDVVEKLKPSTGVFMTGGNQVRLARILTRTRAGETVARLNRNGVPVAGTSAGASVMSTVMVAGGQSGPTPRQKMAKLSRGLGLIDSVIIDQHFTERNRVSRLVAMVSYNPGLLGIGIDEDTAALISSDGVIEVIGRGSVLIVDGSQMESDIERVNGTTPPTISNALIHFVAEGGKYSLDERHVVPQD
ncbi:MAG: cyanophycinase [Thermomicrobiaceae bacterium]